MNNHTDPWQCARCTSMFDRFGKKGIGRSWCAPCRREYVLAYIEKHPEKYFKPCPQCGGRCGLQSSVCASCRKSNRAPKPRNCAFCLLPFTPKSKATAKHCSSDCRNAHKHQLTKDPDHGTSSECAWCFTFFTSSSHRPCCSGKCWSARDQHYLTWRRPFVCQLPTCIDCDVVISMSTHGKRCPECQLAFDSRRQNFSDARRRQVERAGDTDIHWRRLGDRDVWLCHLCGLRVPKVAGSAKAKQGATVDHLVPISAGGSHTWDNVALAHLSCNLKRGVGGFVQLRLVG